MKNRVDKNTFYNEIAALRELMGNMDDDDNDGSGLKNTNGG